VVERIPEYIRYCKKWFGGARCQNADLYFSPSGFGFNVPDILSLFHEYQLQQAHTLKYSFDKNIGAMFAEVATQLSKLSKCW
jgi:hypothetical protein